METSLSVNGSEYRIVRLLGHGKGGYSYLAERDGRQVVLKQIHHEPCGYYTFGNKIEAERHDYERLAAAGIRIPEMLDIDVDAERIVKEYIDGDIIFDLVKNDVSIEPYLEQVPRMAAQAMAAGLNIDYFPTNFVAQGGLLYYIDYECNSYMEEWSFENWGIRYWSRTPEFEEYLRTHTN
ncbi:MAG: serine/threonine-protein kinase [Oscillospiraceae bacterium]|nr:serine/threonine-protein kinase [Oscillospiraceae bacterium]